MRYELSNVSDIPPFEVVHLTINVEAPYAEAIQILDAAREAEQDIRAAQKAEERAQLHRAMGLGAMGLGGPGLKY